MSILKIGRIASICILSTLCVSQVHADTTIEPVQIKKVVINKNVLSKMEYDLKCDEKDVNICKKNIIKKESHLKHPLHLRLRHQSRYRLIRGGQWNNWRYRNRR